MSSLLNQIRTRHVQDTFLLKEDFTFKTDMTFDEEDFVSVLYVF